jgi:CO/xanthine dehydrogenase Mo-binding subunit
MNPYDSSVSGKPLLSIVGKPLPRVDAVPKVTGEAEYDSDVHIRGMLHGRILRSPYPHARILDIDTRKAEKLPGVKAVITAEDTPKIQYGLMVHDEQALAVEKVRYVGDEVAAVAAIDEDTAEEALELIRVEYDILPAVLTPEQAMQPGAPVIQSENPSNIAAFFHVETGDVESGFQEADVILEKKFEVASVSQAVMGPIGCVASFDSSGRLNMWMSSMDLFSHRRGLSHVLNMSEGEINLIRKYCGGAQGLKNLMEPVYPICAFLAKKAGKPVRLYKNREEDFIAGRPRPSCTINSKVGIKRDWTICARQTEIVQDAGAHAGFAPIHILTYTRGDNLYRIENSKTDAKAVYTNKTPGGAYRGFGSPESLFAFNSMIDMLAEEIGMDPLDIQLKNGARPGTVSPHGWKIGSCGLRECLEKVAAETVWRERRSKKRPKRGMGLACQIHASDMRYWDGFMGSVTFVEILEDGKVLITTGENEYGQGIETVEAQIVAEVLGIPLEDVRVLEGSTDTVPFSIGPVASRATISGGTAAKLAAEDARDQLFKLASEMMEANPEDFEIRAGRISVKGYPDRFVTVAEVARLSQSRRGGSAIIGKGVDRRDTDYVFVWPPPGRDQERPIQTRVLSGNPSSAYFFSAHVVEVEVDTETGKVKVLRIVQADDLGKAINPMMAEGQTEGGTIQGLGFSLMEELRRDNNGRIVNPNFLDYKPPTALDAPDIKVIHVESNEALGPFGAKGLGEASQNCSAGAMANAIYDAIGVRITSLPITPEKILKALKQKTKPERSRHK